MRPASTFSDVEIAAEAVMIPRSEGNSNIAMTRLIERSLSNGNGSNGSSATLDGALENRSVGTIRLHAASGTPGWMPVLVGLMSVAMIVLLPLCVKNHIKLQIQGERTL